MKEFVFEGVNDTNNMDRLLSKAEVLVIIGRSSNTLRRWCKNGLFPRPITVGQRSLAWFASEVYEWLRKRPRTYVPDEDSTD